MDNTCFNIMKQTSNQWGKKPQFDGKEPPINKTCFNLMNQTSDQWKYTSNRLIKLQFTGNKAQFNETNL
jgi:hypothetical protein